MQGPAVLIPSQDDGHPISVVVCDPYEKKGTMSSYTVYKVRGSDKLDNFDHEKRYSDFDLVRIHLVNRWPGCFIPPLPRKKVIGNSDVSFIEFRRQSLQLFCQQVSKLKHLWYSKQFQTFLRTTGDVQKALKGLPMDSNEDIIKRYDETFPNLSGKQTDTSTLAKVIEFGNYLKKILPIIENFKDMTAGFIEAKNTSFEQFGVLVNYIMPEYEKSCLAVYCSQVTEGKLIFNQPKDEKLTSLIGRLKQMLSRQEFEQLHRILQLEEREIQAFIEIYKVKDNYESKLKDLKVKEKDLILEQQKLNAGKQNVFKSLLKGNIEENKKTVARDIEICKDDIRTYSFICDLITLLLGHFQIDRFQREKVSSYFTVIKELAQFQAQFTAVRTQIYQHILENHNLMI